MEIHAEESSSIPHTKLMGAALKFALCCTDKVLDDLREEFSSSLQAPFSNISEFLGGAWSTSEYGKWCSPLCVVLDKRVPGIVTEQMKRAFM